MPCFRSCSATRALVASLGQVQKRMMLAVAGNLAVAALQVFRRNLQRARESTRVGQHIQRVPQIDDHQRLARFHLVLQFVGRNAVALHLLDEAIALAPAKENVGNHSGEEEHQHPSAETLGVEGGAVESLAEEEARPREGARPQQRPGKSKSRNSGNSTPTMPASVGAAVFSPGTNLQMSSVRAPYLVKVASVRRTQESGSSAIRHSKFRTTPPRFFPNPYQKVSASREAKEEARMTKARCIRPCEASAPAASSSGDAGIGSPPCSMRTQPKSSR